MMFNSSVHYFNKKRRPTKATMTARRRECLQLLLICSADTTAWGGFVYLLMHTCLLTRFNPEVETIQASSARPAELQHQDSPQMLRPLSGVSPAAPLPAEMKSLCGARPASPGGPEPSQCHLHQSSATRWSLLSSPTPRVKGNPESAAAVLPAGSRLSLAAHRPEVFL
ncbi:hypothetical protein XENORESO_019393 [Xenotaenia resolanae]|uniref:Uncharacterized protein n=1 Tax=Xenotaenia resolanae TaxID=208358 RepID=A0ABV0VRI4_9TELE